MSSRSISNKQTKQQKKTSKKLDFTSVSCGMKYILAPISYINMWCSMQFKASYTVCIHMHLGSESEEWCNRVQGQQGRFSTGNSHGKGKPSDKWQVCKLLKENTDL